MVHTYFRMQSQPSKPCLLYTSSPAAEGVEVVKPRFLTPELQAKLAQEQEEAARRAAEQAEADRIAAEKAAAEQEAARIAVSYTHLDVYKRQMKSS